MRSLVNWDRAGLESRTAAPWCLTLCLVLFVSLMTFSPAAGQFYVKAGGAPAAGGGNQASEWIELDAEADLTGLWGEIDLDHDKDSYYFTDTASGNDHLIWSAWNGSFFRIVHAERPAGLSWQTPDLVQQSSGSTLNNVTPTGTVDEQGLLHVAWVRIGAANSFVYHAVHVSGGWTVAEVISGNDSFASGPTIWEEAGTILVDYVTDLDLVHLEVEVVGYMGGSDDVDPTEITVNSWELGRSIIPK
jgi:hypothetical protein